MRHFLELSYDGTNYAGWQRQPNVITVQKKIEDGLQTLLNQQISITGCGRTDKGVHATQYYGHFDADLDSLSGESFIYKLNGILPRDIACHNLIETPLDAHARYDALHRAYSYNIHFDKSPFKGRFSTFYPNGKRLNFDLLHLAAKIILKTKDFTSFCKAHTDNKTKLCNIYESEWDTSPDSGQIEYKIKANRFLRGMVRLIVGSSLNVALGKMPIEDFVTHIRNRTRNDKMSSAPSNGLALTEVKYEFL